MKPYFGSPQRRAALVATASHWFGTPFHPHAAIQRGGVDCVWLAARIYIECGAIAEFNPPPYTMDGGSHNELSQVLAWLNQSNRFLQVLESGVKLKLEAGDLLCFRMGRVEHHVGVVLTESTFIHSVRVHGVTESHLNDSTWHKRLAAVYRPIEP